MNTLNKNKRVSFLLISIFLFTLVFAAFPVYAGAESTGQWQLIKTPVSGTVKTNDYMVEYSANIVTYHSYHAYGNMKVVKGTLLSQLPQTIQAGEKLNLNTSAEIVSIQEGIDQGTFSGVLTAQGGITHGKVYSIVNDNGVYFPKTNSLEVIAEKGDPSKTSEGHYIRVRFDCNGYDASQLDNWYVYEWVEGASATPAPTTVSGASGWQLIKTPVSGTVTTNDYMVEYSANVVTYHSYHAYGNMKVVKGTLLNQLPQTIQVGEKLTLNTSAELISIQEGIDQTNFSGVLTAQGGIKYGKIYSIVNDNGVNFPKTNTLEVIAEKGDPSKTSEGHYIRIRFDCNGYDASQLDNWYVYEWVEGTGSGSAAVSPGANRIILTLGNPSFTVNGSKQEIDPGKGTKPVTLNGRTVIPIRAVVEAMGGTVAWDPATNRITLTANGITLEMWLGSYVITVNGVTKQIEVAPSTISGRTMVPVRFAAENLGCGVNWDPVNKVVTITY